MRPYRAHKYNSTPFLTEALDGSGWLTDAPTAVRLGKTPDSHCTKGWSLKTSHNNFLSVPFLPSFLPAFISLLSTHFQIHAETDLTTSHDKSFPAL
jgi:hypothetical protein